MRVPSLPESNRAALAWLGLAVLICYGNAFFGSFQFDDFRVIVDNPVVHSWQAWLGDLGHGIRPLLKLTYTLDWTLGGGTTFSFHLTNLLIHLANTFLVYRLSAEFLRRQPQHRQLHYVPLFVALLFATHPAHTEAVTYICGRSTELMTLFYLGALLAYVAGRSQNRNLYVYAVTPLLFVLALSTKETAATFPLALLAWEIFCGGDWQKAYKTQWPVWLVLLVCALFFLFNSSYFVLMAESVQHNNPSGNLATQLMAFAWLLQQWALRLWLNIDPDLPQLHSLSAALPPLLLFLAACAAMLVFRRSRPWISFALAWAIAHLFALYVVLPRTDIANDRELYLASWPLLLALCSELALTLHGGGAVGSVHPAAYTLRVMNLRSFRRIAATLVIVLAVMTIVRNRVYTSEIALWENTVRLSPDKARVHNNLGYTYLLAHRDDDAQREFSTALRLDPGYSKARNNLERVANEMGTEPN